MDLSIKSTIWQKCIDCIKDKLASQNRYKVIMDGIMTFSTNKMHGRDLKHLLKALIYNDLNITTQVSVLFQSHLHTWLFNFTFHKMANHVIVLCQKKLRCNMQYSLT